ncbi:MAG: hypothetical protein QF415_09800 [Candidatus Undinarchaeales archaeon]|jgi:hypothetical protein|nr:hypothetical protein [Candidatus Undinarchaeales archaeon]MDP7492449.1 hypothetical protein [Candidatus Undinarchaeales archaeon]
MKPPCEIVTMHILPAVRASLSRTLVEKHGMKRAVVAKRLGVTQAAVTQYFKAVRGTRNKALINENFSDLIDEIAARIARGEGELETICGLCRTIRSNERFKQFLEQDHCDLCTE